MRNATCDDLWKIAGRIRADNDSIRRVIITVEHENGATLSVEDCASGVASAAPRLPTFETSRGPHADLPWTGS